MKQLKKDCRGVTLVELIVAVTLLAIVLPLIYQFHFSVQKGFDVTVNVQEKQRAAQQVAAQVQSALENAGTITFCSDKQILTKGQQLYADAADARIYSQAFGQSAKKLTTTGDIPVKISFAPVLDERDDALAAVSYTVTAGTDANPSTLSSVLYLPNINAIALKELQETVAAGGTGPYSCVTYTIP